MPRTKAGFNFDGSLSFFDRVVFPTAGKAHAGKMEQLLGSNNAATTINSGFQGSEIDRQQNSAAIQARQVENFDRAQAGRNAVTNIQDQLLGRPVNTPGEAVEQVKRTMSDDPRGFSSAPNPNDPRMQFNEFAQDGPSLLDRAKGLLGGGVQSSPQQQDFAAQVQARSKENTSKAAQAFVAAGISAGQGLPPWRFKKAQSEFAQQYPEFAQMNPLKALTPEQGKEILQADELSTKQRQADARAKEAGVESPQYVRNERGVIEIDKGWTEHMKIQKKAESDRAIQHENFTQRQESRYQAEVNTEEFSRFGPKNPFDPKTQIQQWDNYNILQRTERTEKKASERASRKKFFPHEFSDTPEERVPLRQRQETQQARAIAQSNGLDAGSVVSDQDDIEDFKDQATKNGAAIRVVDATDGKIKWIHPRTN